jgi:hypothetical protein
MADAFVKLVDGCPEVSQSGLNKAKELQVMVSFDAMLETARAFANGQTPEHALCGEIVGTGMLLEGQALLDMFGDAQFRRILFDSATGQLLDYGRSTYRPPKKVIDHVRHRDRTCRVPGCVRPAASSDLDHIQPWDSGGRTSPPNLAVLCRTHHVLKTHAGWEYFATADGVVRWRTPSGMTLDQNPNDYFDLVPGFALSHKLKIDDGAMRDIATSLTSGSWSEMVMAHWVSTQDKWPVEYKSTFGQHDVWQNQRLTTGQKLEVQQDLQVA